jgi:hypothetical protein
MAVLIVVADSALERLSRSSQFNLCTYLEILKHTMLKNATDISIDIFWDFAVQGCSQLHLLKFICIVEP